MGYSRMKLQEAYDLSTTNGYFRRKEEKLKNPGNAFEAKLIKERCENK